MNVTTDEAIWVDDEKKPVRYVLRCMETDEVKVVTMKQILKLINGNRGRQWVKYDETDWQEGLERFTTWAILMVINPL